MGCDGYIENINEPINVEVRCYKCSGVIVLDDSESVKKHIVCSVDGRLSVDIDIDNYRSR